MQQAQQNRSYIPIVGVGARWVGFAVAALALGACEIVPGQEQASTGFSAEALGPIETEAQLRERVVGRTLYYGEDTVIITAAGRLDGNVTGEPLTGTWHWDESYWCRTVTSEQELELADCQVFEATSQGLQVTTRRGDGDSFLYTLSPPGADPVTDAAPVDVANEAIATEAIEEVPLEPVVEGAPPAQ